MNGPELKRRQLFVETAEATADDAAQRNRESVTAHHRGVHRARRETGEQRERRRLKVDPAQVRSDVEGNPPIERRAGARKDPLCAPKPEGGYGKQQTSD